ncbi:Small glutamine-rich tetratricopeptide repeat-containing protein 2 [Neocucurbitaria cava]|uniref:Small glutamine-rich tetratricopeptide repeat-containing protein 2 n=1 Tax=Neocucurbitaria cava TaxID=798079 RepID=A0A9W9CKM6_9PLEO|nr:Small glutamine-rich tetratricopeptide repeat-containing protein 2 [Neocucurbitaria cava]
MATNQSKKRLALAILDFLQTSQTDGSVAPDDAEQLEVAANCIAEAFKVDVDDEAAKKDALGGQNLLAIYNVYEKLKGKTTATTEGSSSASEARPATPQTPAANAPGPGGPNKTEAERLKGLGNEAMKKKDYDGAIKHYTAALEVIPLNPIYLSNRAAAYSGQGKHELAKEDAEMAVAADPNYSKAWSRLGLAKYVLGDAKGAMDAYKSGMDAEGGGSEVMRKGYETAKKKYEEEGGDVGAPDADEPRGAPGGGGGMPDLSSLAGMLGGGGGGGGGGMPDLAGLMQNPMMRQMAQNLMSNPDMMNNLMSNPRIAEMAQQFGGGGGGGGRGGGGGGGGGMPDLSALMNDPNLADM